MTGDRTPGSATYLAVLVGCLAATAPLEPRSRVYRQTGRWLASIAPVAAAFAVWDTAAFKAGWWSLDPAQTTGIETPGGLPLEEALFFAAIPTCALLAVEAVRARKPHWT